jgi:N6-adenosine-specific RNA methylase IME4
MGRRPIGKRPLTPTEMQRRWRAGIKHKAATERRAAVIDRLVNATRLEGARLGTMSLYPLIVADPPWRFTTRSEHGRGRSAENHYPTMTLEELKALSVPAAPNGLLFMWSTSPMLAQAIELMGTWGFDYGGFVAWDKEIIGTGYRFRSQVELLLYGAKGRGLPIPPPADRVCNLITARRGAHSEKPVELYDLLARQYPGVPRLEMFARTVREGWDAWGNEAVTPRGLARTGRTA